MKLLSLELIILSLYLSNTICFFNYYKSKNRQKRISQGHGLNMSSHSYVVGIKSDSFSNIPSFCTGSLIKPLYVLTAGHCIHLQLNIEVWAINRETRFVTQIFVHPNYHEDNVIADIGILKLNETFSEIENCIKLSNLKPNVIRHNKLLNCEIVGWGETGNNNSLVNNANIANVMVSYGPTACFVPLIDPNNQMKKILESTWDEFLCSIPNGKCICPGDSGGPLICDGSQIGVASHIYNYINNSYDSVCGDTYVQSRHTYIYKYTDWIVRSCSSQAVSYKSKIKLIFNLIVLVYHTLV